MECSVFSTKCTLSPCTRGWGRSLIKGVDMIHFPSARYSPNFHTWQPQNAGVLKTKVDRFVFSSQIGKGILSWIARSWKSLFDSDFSPTNPPSKVKKPMERQARMKRALAKYTVSSFLLYSSLYQSVLRKRYNYPLIERQSYKRTKASDFSNSCTSGRRSV